MGWEKQPTSVQLAIIKANMKLIRYICLRNIFKIGNVVQNITI